MKHIVKVLALTILFSIFTTQCVETKRNLNNQTAKFWAGCHVVKNFCYGIVGKKVSEEDQKKLWGKHQLKANATGKFIRNGAALGLSAFFLSKDTFEKVKRTRSINPIYQNQTIINNTLSVVFTFGFLYNLKKLKKIFFSPKINTTKKEIVQ